MHLLFWLSLVPFGTAWIGETQFATIPMALYGVVLLMCAFAYGFLVSALMRVRRARRRRSRGPRRRPARAGSRRCIYLAAIPIAFVAPYVSFGMYVFVAAMWIVPDPRIERRIAD